MAALRAALANERSANIEEKHSQLDEHHVEGLWVGVWVTVCGRVCYFVWACV